MGTSKYLRFSFLRLTLLLLISTCYCIDVHADDNLTIFVAQPTTLSVSSGSSVEKSPGSKTGVKMVGQRVQIYGLSRVHNLRKYAHSIRVKVSVNDTSVKARLNNVDVCFHRNSSLGTAMCPQNQWEKVVKGSWSRSMSPFDSKLIDLRMPGPYFTNVEVSVEEEFYLYRIVFLVLGIVLLPLAPTLSKCVTFYYSGAMTVGIILVILMVLFQGMKLLPTGRKNSLAIFLYSSVVGMGSFLLRYLPGLLRSALVEIGISEDMYNPLVTVLLVCIILAGAWLGFWVVRRLVLSEDGSVDSSVSLFVAWSIRILSAVMIIQSSLDPLLAAEALLSGILLSMIARRVIRSRSLRRLLKTSKSNRRRSDSPTEDSLDDEYVNKFQSSEERRHRAGTFNLSSCSSPLTARHLMKTPPSHDKGTYYSTFHKTPDRKKFSKEEWESFTKDSTRKALEGLVSSPDFNKWAVANAERITLTPTNDQAKQHRRWVFW